MSSFHPAVFFGDISPTVFLAVGYALFLLAAAGGLELLARNVHHHSQRFRTAGFTYHRHLDVWECSQGQHLLPTAAPLLPFSPECHHYCAPAWRTFQSLPRPICLLANGYSAFPKARHDCFNRCREREVAAGGMGHKAKSTKISDLDAL